MPFTTRYLGDPAVNKQVRWLKPVFDAQKAVHYTIDYFQKQFSSGPVSLDATQALIWELDNGTSASGRDRRSTARAQAVIDGRYGRYLSA